MTTTQSIAYNQRTTPSSSTILDWVTIDTFCQSFPNIPKKTLKWQLSCRHKNGLAPFVQVIGRQRFISVQGYATWLNQNVSTK